MDLPATSSSPWRNRTVRQKMRLLGHTALAELVETLLTGAAPWPTRLRRAAAPTSAGNSTRRRSCVLRCNRTLTTCSADSREQAVGLLSYTSKLAETEQGLMQLAPTGRAEACRPGRNFPSHFD